MPFSTGQLSPNESESIEFKVGDTLRFELSCTDQPYEIDIETKKRNESDSAYTRIQPLQDLGKITVTDTSRHTYETGRVEDDVRITVTNTGSDALRASGDEKGTQDDVYFQEDGRSWIYATKGDLGAQTVSQIDFDDGGTVATMKYNSSQSRTEIQTPSGNTAFIDDAGSGDLLAGGGVDSIEEISGTSDIASVNSTLSGLSSDKIAVLHGEFTVGGTAIQIPSGATVINVGTLKQADNAGDNAVVVENADHGPNGTDEDIEFGSYGGLIDGNNANQTSDVERYGMSFQGVDGLRLWGHHVLNPEDFCVDVRDATNIYVENLRFDITNPTDNQDGIHFTNCSDVTVNGIYGTTQDDILAIDVDDDTATISDYSVSNVQGTSTGANGVRITRAAAATGQSTIEDMELSGIQVHGAAANGIVFSTDDPANTLFRNISIEGVIADPTGDGVLLQDSTYESIYVDVNVSGADRAFDAFGVTQMDGCQFNVVSQDPADDSEAMRLSKIDNSEINLVSKRSSANSFKGHILLQEGSNCRVNAVMQGGNERGFQVASSSLAVTDCVFNGVTKNVSDDIVEIGGGGADNNTFRVQTADAAIGISLAGSSSTANGVGEESSNAETPQNSWNAGDIVDFTDSGDGSGNGFYIIDLSGSPQAI